MFALDLDSSVNDTPQTLGDARHVVVQPVTICQQDPVDITNEVFLRLHSLLESTRAALFFTLNEKDDVSIETLFFRKFMGSVYRGHDGSFVIGHTATVQVTTFAGEGERVMIPLAVFILGRDDIVVTVEEDLLARCSGRRVASEFRKDNGIVWLAGVDHLRDSAKVLEYRAQVRCASPTICAILG